jgi:hypothetical protein
MEKIAYRFELVKQAELSRAGDRIAIEVIPVLEAYFAPVDIVRLLDGFKIDGCVVQRNEEAAAVLCWDATLNILRVSFNTGQRVPCTIKSEFAFGVFNFATVIQQLCLDEFNKAIQSKEPSDASSRPLHQP